MLSDVTAPAYMRLNVLEKTTALHFPKPWTVEHNIYFYPLLI